MCKISISKFHLTPVLSCRSTLPSFLLFNHSGTNKCRKNCFFAFKQYQIENFFLFILVRTLYSLFFIIIIFSRQEQKFCLRPFSSFECPQRPCGVVFEQNSSSGCYLHQDHHLKSWVMQAIIAQIFTLRLSTMGFYKT